MNKEEKQTIDVYIEGEGIQFTLDKYVLDRQQFFEEITKFIQYHVDNQEADIGRRLDLMFK